MKPGLKKFVRGFPRFLIVAALVLPLMVAGVIRADTTWVQTSQADFETGTLYQVDASASPGDVKLEPVASNYIYALQGNRQYGFWRYDITAGTWTSLQNVPSKVKWGGALTGDGGNYIYALRGYDTYDFWRYDIAADIWTSLTSTPDRVSWGGALTCDGGNYIYALRGNDTRDFWRYDIAAGTWTSLADTGDYVAGGGALTYDGGNYIYSFQCVDTETLYRYDISADTWELLADSPADIGNGAALAYDGGDAVYALRGSNSADFWRYNVSADTWSVMDAAPTTVDWGGALAYDGSGSVYALRGANSSLFWRYDIAGGWAFMANTPGNVKEGGALTLGGSSYQTSGTLTSATHDTGYAADFGSVSWTETSPAGTEIAFQLATNNDNATWDFVGPDGTSGTYYASSGTAVWTGHNGDRYVRYKAYFSTTDTSVTPTLHDISLTYNPATPTVVPPAVTTVEAVSVEETTATLRGTVTDDGGEACQYRFQYGTSPGVYTANTTWSGSLTTGQSFSLDVTGLGEGTKYYFRAQAQNSAGTADGEELSLLTKPLEPTSFSATALSDTEIELSWSMGTGAQRTMVRRQTGDYPADITEGEEVYFDTGNSVTDTGLLPGETYYYAAWSEVTGSQQWSDAAAAVIATTGPYEPPVSVGGTIYPVDKAQLLEPLSFSLMVVSLVLGLGSCGVVFYLTRGGISPPRAR